MAHIGPGSQDGHRFVRAFALLTQCHVIAPTERQGSLVAAPDWFPAQFIDTYEGLVLNCDPQGHVTRQARFASLARLPDGRLQLPAGHE